MAQPNLPGWPYIINTIPGPAKVEEGGVGGSGGRGVGGPSTVLQNNDTKY